MSTYTIPDGNKVAFPFVTGTYIIPDGNKVAFHFGGAPGTIFAIGFSAVDFGTASVVNATQQIFPSGWDSGIVNGNVLFTKSIIPTGWNSSAYGTAHVYNLNQAIFPVGFNAFQGFGLTWASYVIRRLTFVTLGDTSKFGTLSMSGGVRTVSAQGIAPGVLGTPTVWFSLRQVFPLWFIATLWGTAKVDRNHPVDPVGFGGETFGMPEVFYPRFIVDLAGLGIPAGAVGDHDVELHIQIVAPVGICGAGQTEVDRFGQHDIHNLTQYITQLFEVTPSDGGVFGDNYLIENRNKVIKPDPMATARYGTPSINNNARIITTPPFQDFSSFGQHLVAPYYRYLLPEGDDMSAFGSPLNMIVYNAARQLFPAGWKDELFGLTKVFGNRQFTTTVGFDMSLLGVPMVAFAIRGIQPFAIPGDFPFGLVNVSNYQRYITPPGIDDGVYGVPTLEIHFTIIAPSSALPPSNQVPTGAHVFNVTPQLYEQGANHAEYGTPAIHNQFEVYNFQGFDTSIFGNAVVKDRKQTIGPTGWNQFVLTNSHQVRNVNPDPPGQQNITPAAFNPTLMGMPSVRTNVIAPNGILATGFGSPTMVRMGLSPVGITPPYDDITGSQFGTASLNRPLQMLAQGSEFLAWGLPDVGPRYVWAPRGYPYTTGFWSDQGQQMDESIFGQDHPERPVFGTPVVTYKNRIITQVNNSSAGSFGNPSFGLRLQYIRPTGVKLQKFGIPVLNGGGAINPFGFDQALYGKPLVQILDRGPKTLHMTGFAAGSFGQQDVENFNRPIYPVGWVEFKVSAPVPPSWPRASTWVSNAYDPFSMVGFDASSFGTTWVSFRVRPIFPMGADSALVNEYTPGQFADRMRVTKNAHFGTGAEGVTAGSTGALGTPTIALANRNMQTIGFADEEIGLAVLRHINRVNVSGWESLIFGDVQKWEAGTIKPHGDEMSSFGNARFNRVVLTQGWTGDMGIPSVGAVIGASSFGGSGFGVPTMVANVCDTRAMAVGGFNAGSVGTPGVHA